MIDTSLAAALVGLAEAMTTDDGITVIGMMTDVAMIGDDMTTEIDGRLYFRL